MFILDTPSKKHGVNFSAARGLRSTNRNWRPAPSTVVAVRASQGITGDRVGTAAGGGAAVTVMLGP